MNGALLYLIGDEEELERKRVVVGGAGGTSSTTITYHMKYDPNLLLGKVLK